jgi:hypothetical protein
MTKEKLGPKARETFARLEREEPPLFPVVLREHMDEADIESLEELYHRFLTETDYRGCISVPGRHRNKPVGFEEFKRHASSEYGYLYEEFIDGLIQVFGLTDRDSVSPLVLTYAFPRGFRRQRPPAKLASKA